MTGKRRRLEEEEEEEEECDSHSRQPIRIALHTLSALLLVCINASPTAVVLKPLRALRLVHCISGYFRGLHRFRSWDSGRSNKHSALTCVVMRSKNMLWCKYHTSCDACEWLFEAVVTLCNAAGRRRVLGGPGLLKRLKGPPRDLEAQCSSPVRALSPFPPPTHPPPSRSSLLLEAPSA